jgi:imidazolonepropionase
MTISTIPTCDRVWINANLATMDPAVAAPYGTMPGHAIGVRTGKIAFMAPMDAIPEIKNIPAAEIIDARGGWITPGWIDCHTHLVYGGNRSREIERRWSGVSYEEIARAGGGILATVRATRALDASQLFDASLPRLDALVREGATTVEIKSGYGLTFDDEMKMLRVARRLGERVPVRIRTTLLAAHAVPPEFTGRADEYVDWICREMIPAASAEGLADAVDVFCEHIAFSIAQCRRIFEAAEKYGLPVKGHFEQRSNLGGARLAAQCRAVSADHLEHLDAEGVEALARSRTTAVLLPGAFYFLKETRRPPVELLRAAGVPMAVATDLNPGTCPLASIRLAINMACVQFGLTPEEALTGATRHAARALGLSDLIGTLAVGRSADFLVWDIEHPAELVCELGVSRPRQRIFQGISL